MNEMNDDVNKNGNPGFGAPEGYFDALGHRIRVRVEQFEELVDYPNLQKRGKSVPFSVPAGFFETNALQIKTKVQHTGADSIGKVVKAPWLFVRKRALRSVAAAAAALAGILFAVFQYPENDDADCNTLACIERTELMQSSLIENVSEDEIFDMVDYDRLKERLNRDIREPE